MMLPSMPIKEISRYLRDRSKLFFIVLGMSIILFISVIDFVTKDFFVLEFYIVPIVLVAWFSGRRAGLFMAVIGALASSVLDIIESPHHASSLIHYWNFFMNCGFFLLIVYFVTALKEAMELKSKFTSMISHEIRTPLAVVSESINIMLDGLGGDINEKQKDILSTASANAHRLNRLINDILDFHKFESGKMRLDLEKNDINQVVREAYKGIEILGKEKDLRFIFTLDKDVPKTKFDKDRVGQVITNLVINAIKFTDKGSITVTTERKENTIQVSVCDTGFGIRPEEMPKLFKSFEQLGAPGKRGTKGTGLGLVISKEIITRHGGRIWAESVPGKGTGFYFTLPLK